MAALDLSELLDSLDHDAASVQRHLWLIRWVTWVRGDCTSVDTSLSRISLFLDALAQRPQARALMQRWWGALLETVDATTLLADYGFASRASFVNEFSTRLRLKLLPATPETTDASALFSLVFSHPFDTVWIRALDQASLSRLADLLQPPAPKPVSGPHSTASSMSPWQIAVVEAIGFCTSQIRASGFTPELRLRMSASAREAGPFHTLAANLDALQRELMLSGRQPGNACVSARDHFLGQLDACRQAAASVYAHLDEYGISVGLVFQLRQMRARILRVHSLLNCLLAPDRYGQTSRLLAHLVTVGQERRSLRALITENSSMLATKVAERSSETGEHYITRTLPAYQAMLRQAAGGGAVMSLTTLAKFLILSAGFSAFWGGLLAGLNYALSFLLVQMLHWTVATKQPAMTAPAMAAKLKDLNDQAAVERFVDEVSNLTRSQMAAIFGNLALVIPCVLLISWVMLGFTGQPMINSATAEQVLHDLTLLGPTALFAALTGVLLFVSSIIAGWAENWFVLHRLESALRYNPGITSSLGLERADRWAVFMRKHISGIVANVSLGLMLGLVPAVCGFFGLGLEVRHVTLSTGQLAAALGSLGTSIFSLPAFWWCVSGLVATGLLNVGVSYYLAFRLALRAHNVSGVDRLQIRKAIKQRVRSCPLSFFWPEVSPSHAGDVADHRPH